MYENLTYDEMVDCLSFREKDHAVKSVMKYYPPVYRIEEVKRKPESDLERRTMERIDWMISLIPEEEGRRIFTAEYIRHEPRGWWREYYSRSTYYRIKGASLACFLHCLRR